MIHDFADFCTYVFVIVDDILQELAPLLKRPGPAPECSDSELITMVLVGECKGWNVETELLSNMRSHRDLFPSIPSQSRCNRRRRNLMYLINLIRQILLSRLCTGSAGNGELPLPNETLEQAWFRHPGPCLLAQLWGPWPC